MVKEENTSKSSERDVLHSVNKTLLESKLSVSSASMHKCGALRPDTEKSGSDCVQSKTKGSDNVQSKTKTNSNDKSDGSSSPSLAGDEMTKVITIKSSNHYNHCNPIPPDTQIIKIVRIPPKHAKSVPADKEITMQKLVSGLASNVTENIKSSPIHTSPPMQTKSSTGYIVKQLHEPSICVDNESPFTSQADESQTPDNIVLIEDSSDDNDDNAVKQCFQDKTLSVKAEETLVISDDESVLSAEDYADLVSDDESVLSAENHLHFTIKNDFERKSHTQIMTELKHFQRQGIFMDCAVYSSNKTCFLCHAIVLAMRCPLLRRALHKLKNEMYVIELELTDIEVQKIINSAYSLSDTGVCSADFSCTSYGEHTNNPPWTENLQDCFILSSDKSGSGENQSEYWTYSTHVCLLAALSSSLYDCLSNGSPGRYNLLGLMKDEAKQLVDRASKFITENTAQPKKPGPTCYENLQRKSLTCKLKQLQTCKLKNTTYALPHCVQSKGNLETCNSNRLHLASIHQSHSRKSSASLQIPLVAVAEKRLDPAKIHQQTQLATMKGNHNFHKSREKSQAECLSSSVAKIRKKAEADISNLVLPLTSAADLNKFCVAHVHLCRVDNERPCNVRLLKKHKVKIPDRRFTKNRPGTGRFTCSKCSKRFTLLWNMQRHIRSIHGELQSGSFTCSKCSKRFKSFWSMQRHIRNIHGELQSPPNHTCKWCQRSFKSSRALRKHEFHNGYKPHFRCKHCFKTFRTQHLYDSHVSIHTGSKPVKCTFCSLHFRWWSDVYKHCKKVHGCRPSCNKTVMKHIQSGDSKQKSATLTSEYSDNTSPVSQENCTEKQRYISILTPKHRGSKTSSKRVNSKSVESNHTCRLCGKSFNLFSSLGKHYFYCAIRKSQQDTQEKELKKQQHKCHICGSSFFWLSGLMCHIRIKHKKGKVVQKRKHGYYVAARPHKQKQHERKCEANMSGAPIEISSSASSDVETVENFYQCKHCPKTFTKKIGLKLHQTIHTRGRKCRKCDKVFRTWTSYRLHCQRQHPINSLTAKHKCKVCSLKYTNIACLKKHIMNDHSLDTNQVASKQMEVIKQTSQQIRGKSANRMKRKLYVASKGERTNGKCGLCSLTYYNKQSLKKHTISAHWHQIGGEQLEYQRNIYPVKSKNKSRFKRLIQDAHSVSTNRDDVEKLPVTSPTTKQSKGDSVVRLTPDANKGKSKEHRCSICFLKYSNSGNLSRHKKMAHSGGTSGMKTQATKHMKQSRNQLVMSIKRKLNSAKKKKVPTATLR